MISRFIRGGAVVGLIAGVSLLGYAFTASNTVPASNAGDGSGVINGYTVSDVTYMLDTDGDITEVDFSLSSSATTVYASLDGGTLASCSGTGTGPWTCDVTDVPSASAASLRVVAAQ